MKIVDPFQTVFVVHNGNQDYLSACLKSSRMNGNYTILIGNDERAAGNAHEFYSDAIECPEYKMFEENYQHMSSNSAIFELLCFKRYFLLLTVARIKKIEYFWMIDSDVLLLESLDNFTVNYLLKNKYKASLSGQKNTNQYPEEYSIGVSPHISFWTIEALENFVNFCLVAYSDKKDILCLKYRYHVRYKLPGGICDMTILDLWKRDYRGVFNNATAHLLGFSFYDHNINVSCNYDMDCIPMLRVLGIKKVGRDGLSCNVWSPSLNIKFTVGCLHFQGGAKKFMRSFLRYQKTNYILYAWYIPLSFLRLVKAGVMQLIKKLNLNY